MSTTENAATKESKKSIPGTTVPALVFGSESEEGRAVLEGLIEAGFDPVYAFISKASPTSDTTYLTDGLGAKVKFGDVENRDDVRKALQETLAQAIYLITTTDLVPLDAAPDKPATSFDDAAMAEYEVMVGVAHMLCEVHRKDPSTSRHIIVSCRDDVQTLNQEIREKTGETFIQPLDDGSVVPHYSAKGKGGKYILDYLGKEAPDINVTLLTMPFFFSNFLGFFCPLPDETKTQWTLAACIGDGAQNIDMMGARDLKYIVPKIFLSSFNNRSSSAFFNGRNIRLVGEQISMDEIAAEFADLFGKDVIYNPLTYEEMAELPFPAAPAIAQMCQFLGRPMSTPQDVAMCQKLVFPKHTQTFQDWLLVHSDSKAFVQVGLDWDAAEITVVAVFGATCKEGISVVKGLLADSRKTYRVRVTSRHPESPEAKALLELAPPDEKDRVELVFADFDDKSSCEKALSGVDGVFFVTNLGHTGNQVMAAEERHVQNLIDACEASHSARHLVFASTTQASAGDPHNHHHYHIWNDEGVVTDDTSVELPLDAKAMAVAYARTKKLSVTYITLPYSEDGSTRCTSDEESAIRTITAGDKIIASVSVEALGPIVADIFDSYQVFAGHELALVTDLDTSAASGNKDEETSGTVKVRGAYMKDLGPMFAELAHSDAVKQRQPIAETLKLIPSSRPLIEWVDLHGKDAYFREKLGVR
ncbi:hypothetical protein ACA910_011325 [Epithemia clementina (nom. ined.)]